MSKKIKAVYDADPTAGDDLTKEGLFAGDDGEDNEVVYTRTQVSNTVAEVGEVKRISDDVDSLLAGAIPPDPEDPSPAATWALTLAQNKLIPDRAVFNYTTEAGAAWAETINTSTPPTYPGDFTDGQVGTLSAVSGWDVTETRRLWEYDDVNGIVQILTSQGESGIEITSVDTLAPVPSTTEWTIAAGTDPSH